MIGDGRDYIQVMHRVQLKLHFKLIRQAILDKIEGDLMCYYGCFEVFDAAIDEFETKIKSAELNNFEDGNNDKKITEMEQIIDD